MTAKAMKQPALGVGPLLLALILGASAAVMLVTSVSYRLEHPSMTMTMRRQNPQAQMPDSAMGRVGELMVQAKEHPDDLATLVELGDLFLRMGSYENAETFLGRAKGLAPRDEEVLRLYGMALFHRKDYEGAAEAFGAMIEVDPENAAAHYNLGVLQKHFLKKNDAASEHFRRVLELAPDDEELRTRAREELDAGPRGD